MNTHIVEAEKYLEHQKIKDVTSLKRALKKARKGKLIKKERCLK
jgi:hypothetical protein